MLMIYNIKQSMNENVATKKSIAEQVILNKGPNARDSISGIGVDEKNVIPVCQIGAHPEYVSALAAHKKSDTQHTLASIL
eukprot:1193218-Ditylum_brightwellii.AAC.1